MAWVTNNWFYYGETGIRLNGIRDSEIFQGSAKSLTNVRINDFAGLKVAKEYELLDTASEDIERIIDTSYNWYILKSSSNFFIVNKINDTIIRTITHSIGTITSYSIVDKENLILTIGGSTPIIYKLDETGQTMTLNNAYLNDLLFPLENKEDVLIDLYQKQTVGTSTVITKLQALENPKLDVADDGSISLPGTDLAITRIYIDYKSNPSYEGVGTADGEVFGVLHGVKTIDDTAYYILGNNKISFGDYTNDDKWEGDYFTTITGGASVGELTYGAIIDVKDFNLTTLFQNRLVLENDGTLYFSKQFEYLDFRTPDIPTYTYEPFYMKPGQINGVQRNIIALEATDALNIITDGGVYISGYGFTVTGTNLGNPVLASDIPATSNVVTVENDVFYLTPNGKLKCVQRDYSNTLIEYNVNSVSKFDIKDTFTSICRHTVDDSEYCVATKANDDKVYFFETIGNNEFRRVSYELTADKLLGKEDVLINGDQILKRGDNNKQFMKIELNTPSLKTEKGGSYLNNAHSLISKIVIQTLNEDDEGIKNVTIDGGIVNNLGDNVEDIYSVYYRNVNYKIGSGTEIVIETNQNDKVIEIQGIERKVDPKGV